MLCSALFLLAGSILFAGCDAFPNPQSQGHSFGYAYTHDPQNGLRGASISTRTNGRTQNGGSFHSSGGSVGVGVRSGGSGGSSFHTSTGSVGGSVSGGGVGVRSGVGPSAAAAAAAAYGAGFGAPYAGGNPYIGGGPGGAVFVNNPYVPGQGVAVYFPT